MPVRVLQFSDIHFSSKPTADRVFHDDVREHVITDLQGAWRSGNVDVILIAGDIAFSGKRDEYQRASNWIERVRAITGCPRSGVLMVPGNHDIDRDRLKVSTKLVHRGLRTAGLPQAEAELFQLASAGDPSLMDKLAEYRAFAASYGCFFDSSSKPAWSRSFGLPLDRSLQFHGLSTVQVCDESDAKDAMLLGNHQYVISRRPATENIVMMHHPLEWLRDRKGAESYLSTRARILIVGHKHVQDLQKLTSPDGHERLILASGALTPEHAAAPYIYRYNLLEFDTSPADATPSLSVKIFPRIWSMRHTEFMPDHECLRGQNDATIPLACPQFALQPQPAVVAPPSYDPQLHDHVCEMRQLFWQRLEWQHRIRALMGADILPPTPEAPLPHEIEEVAFRQAETSAKLHKTWDAIMSQLPAAERKPNPFTP